MSSKPTLSSAKHVADKKISKFALLKPRMKPVPRAVPVAKKGAKPQMAGSGKGGAVILRPAGQKPSGAKGQAKGTGKPDKGAGKSWNNSSQQSRGKGGEKGKKGLFYEPASSLYHAAIARARRESACASKHALPAA